ASLAARNASKDSGRSNCQILADTSCRSGVVARRYAWPTGHRVYAQIRSRHVAMASSSVGASLTVMATSRASWPRACADSLKRQTITLTTLSAERNAAWIAAQLHGFAHAAGWLYTPRGSSTPTTP